MKGLHHNVIEIKDTQNSEIEKILVFLRPGDHKINVENTRKDAQEILQKVNVRKEGRRIFSHPRLWILGAGIVIMAVALLMVIF